MARWTSSKRLILNCTNDEAFSRVVLPADSAAQRPAAWQYRIDRTLAYFPEANHNYTHCVARWFWSATLRYWRTGRPRPHSDSFHQGNQNKYVVPKMTHCWQREPRNDFGDDHFRCGIVQVCKLSIWPLARDLVARWSCR